MSDITHQLKIELLTSSGEVLEGVEGVDAIEAKQTAADQAKAARPAIKYVKKAAAALEEEYIELRRSGADSYDVEDFLKESVALFIEKAVAASIDAKSKLPAFTKSFLAARASSALYAGLFDIFYSLPEDKIDVSLSYMIALYSRAAQRIRVLENILEF